MTLQDVEREIMRLQVEIDSAKVSLEKIEAELAVSSVKVKELFGTDDVAALVLKRAELELEIAGLVERVGK